MINIEVQGRSGRVGRILSAAVITILLAAIGVVSNAQSRYELSEGQTEAARQGQMVQMFSREDAS